jgi:hypothetical protein
MSISLMTDKTKHTRKSFRDSVVDSLCCDEVHLETTIKSSTRR